MRVAAVVLLLLSTAASAQEQRIQVSAEMRADIARHIRTQGFDCPDVKDVTYAGRDARGGLMRVACGRLKGPADPSLVFRVSGNAVTGRVTRWQP
jgi:catabolite regulation protein CreA